ncbi:MAG: hypothetical protein Roseis3KO_45550 [Roseivirga sp.]
MFKYRLNGLSIAVINNFEVEWAKAYGVTDQVDKTPVTTETVFQAASMSKTVNAIAILKLKENTQLNLDAEVNTLLNSWQLPYNLKITDQKITLRQLLSHTGGLSTHGFNGYRNTSHLPGIIETLEGQKPANSDKVRPVMVPGKEFRYSGGGTTLSQLILTDTQNDSYEQFIEKELFQPLGLKNAFYSIQLDKYARKEMAYAHLKSGKPIKNKFNYYPESAAAGLWITPTDLASILIDLQLSLKGKPAMILSQASAIEMISPPIENDISGLGVFIEQMKEETYLQHAGSNRGFRGKFMIGSTNGKGVVIMVNGPQTQIIEEILQSVANVYKWPGFEPINTAEISFTKADIEAYTGTFQFQKRTVSVSYKNDTFVMTERGKWTSQLIPLSHKSFILKDVKPQATVDFMVDKDGKVTQLITQQGASVTWTKASDK